jgi:hypothetical protein
MLERSCRRMKDDSWKGFQVRKKRETITDGARRFGTQWTETGRSSCAAEGRVSIVYAGGWDRELGGLRRIGRSERATRFLRNMIALHQWRHQRWFCTQRRGTAGENDRVWYLVSDDAIVGLEITSELGCHMPWFAMN